MILKKKTAHSGLVEIIHLLRNHHQTPHKGWVLLPPPPPPPDHGVTRPSRTRRPDWSGSISARRSLYWTPPHAASHAGYSSSGISSWDISDTWGKKKRSGRLSFNSSFNHQQSYTFRNAKAVQNFVHPIIKQGQLKASFTVTHLMLI